MQVKEPYKTTNVFWKSEEAETLTNEPSRFQPSVREQVVSQAFIRRL